MTTVRQLEREDIAAVSRLFLELTPEARWQRVEDCAAYMDRLLFDNPWRDLAVPSWVATDADRIVGFYLLLPRRMVFRGRDITVAVGCQMSVAPEYRRGLTALQLAKAALSGPQDLTIADGAHEKSRDMWVALGGDAPLTYNLHWIRPLRPARSLLTALVARGALPAPLEIGLRPFAALFDRAASRLRWNRFLHEPGELLAEALDPARLSAAFGDVVDRELQPVYEQQALDWLLAEARARSRERLRATLLRDADGRPAGWYLYTLEPGGTCEVLQIAARRGHFDATFRALAAEAWRAGAGTLRGRGEPGQVETLSARHCWFRREGKCALVHSRHADIREAIGEGRAFLSRLEGEWWLRLVSA